MEEVTKVECPHYEEHGFRPGREVNTVSWYCKRDGRHVSPERDCAACPENGAGDGPVHRQG